MCTLKRISFSLVLAFIILALPVIAQVDKSGVKTNTISLPSGPGSIEGLGESFQPSLNTGQANYQVKLSVPSGTAGHAPELSLRYNGGSGNSPQGYGWSIQLPYVQRQCDKGIPRYVNSSNGHDDDYDGQTDEPDEIDVFINEMKEELVPTQGGFYFCENEGAFIRYVFTGVHWEGTLPNGTLMVFGQTEQARITDGETGNVYTWLLERMTDTNGNAIIFKYKSFDCDKDLNQKYLHQIEYGPGPGPWENFHFVQFDYEERFDWFEDCRPGFRLRTGQLLRSVTMGTQGPTLTGHQSGDFNEDGKTDYLNRRYELEYKSHPHWSLLSKVSWIGSDGQSPYPPITFEYTDVAPPDSLSAEGNIIGEQGAPIQLMDNSLVDLIDLNGDALPDILKTDLFGGSHTVSLNEGELEGSGQSTIRWKQVQTVGSEDGLAWNINLADGQSTVAHLADMDADGLSDLVYKATFGEVYYFKNLGDNSWGPRQLMNDASGSSAPPSPFGTTGVKTADLDFDKRMDIIQSIEVGNGYYYRIWFNLGNRQYSQARTITQEYGFNLSAPGVHIADFNGDRVADILRIRPFGITVTAGMGHGEFVQPMFVPIPDYTLSTEQIEKTRLQDINGDGLMDLIIERPAPNQLWYWLNLGNYSFDKRRLIVNLPSVLGVQPAIRWADMNGNGTTDYVYADRDAAPRLQIVDIGRLIGAVPSPNLLKMVDNGIGQKTKLEYATSTKYLLTDRQNGKEWKDPLPFPVNVVAKATIEDGMGNDYETEFFYHDGYYDGFEKEFRGFATVESQEIGDESAPDLIMAYSFDTGAAEEALKGKQLSAEARNAQGEIFYQENNSWQTKTLYESEQEDGRKVTFPFLGVKEQDIIEKGNGTPVKLKWEYEYDDYGNMTKETEHGRLDEGWDDERIFSTQFTSAFPDGVNQWIIGKVVAQSTTDENENLVAHTKSFFDDNLEPGRLSKGNLTRVENWVEDGKYIVSVRNEYDSYGNISTVYDPLYGIQPGHYREMKYDPYFFTFPEEEVIHTGKSDPASLVFKASYDYGHGVVKTSTEFNGHTTHYAYDPFARLISVTKPLDDIPTVKYDYVLGRSYAGGKTINWIMTEQLDNSPGDGYLHSRTFFDGLGREIMTRAEGEEVGQVVVTGTVQYNKRKQIRKKYLPYFETGTLDFNDPTYNTGFTEHFYDALNRPVRINQPFGPEGIVFSQIQYGPLSTFTQDEEQTNPNSIHFGCGTRKIMDGLSNADDEPRLREVYQLVKMTDLGELTDNIVEWKTAYEYDLLDNMTRFTDAQLNQKIFEYDALSRKTFINDPNRGVMHYQYDDASNLIKTVDAKNQTIRYTYDGVNRLTSEYYGANTPTPDVSYHYDTPFSAIERGAFWQGNPSPITGENALGYLSWVQDLSGEEHNSYDERGRVKWTVKRIIGDTPTDLNNFYTGYEYDAMDRITALTYPDASQVQYLYNKRGLLESIPNVIQQYDYNPAGQNALLALACGTETSYEYDHRLRLSRIHSTRSRDALVLQDLNYSFDGVSNITRITDQRTNAALDIIGGELNLNAQEARKYNATQSFLYDNFYRLTQAANPAVYGTIEYRYDRTGNMVRKEADLIENDPIMDLGIMAIGGPEGSWGRIGRSVDGSVGSNAITSTEKGDFIFTYDANGNMVGDGKVNYNWDKKDRLRSTQTDGVEAHYIYDYVDLRKKKVINDSAVVYYINSFSEWREGRLMKYIYDGANRIAKAVNSQPFDLLPVQFYLYDHLGSLTLTLSHGGDILALQVNYPYGRTRVKKQIVEVVSYTFTGKEFDKESDNFYFDARYYRSDVGRFLSYDPLAELSIDQSPYAYVSSNPITRIDPDGQWDFDFWGQEDDSPKNEFDTETTIGTEDFNVSSNISVENLGGAEVVSFQMAITIGSVSVSYKRSYNTETNRAENAIETKAEVKFLQGSFASKFDDSGTATYSTALGVKFTPAKVKNDNFKGTGVSFGGKFETSFSPAAPIGSKFSVKESIYISASGKVGFKNVGGKSINGKISLEHESKF